MIRELLKIKLKLTINLILTQVINVSQDIAVITLGIITIMTRDPTRESHSKIADTTEILTIVLITTIDHPNNHITSIKMKM